MSITAELRLRIKVSTFSHDLTSAQDAKLKLANLLEVLAGKLRGANEDTFERDLIDDDSGDRFGVLDVRIRAVVPEINGGGGQ